MDASKPEMKSTPASPGRVTFLDGQNEMPMIEISTTWSTAAVYLQGAHVTEFRKKGEPPLLFMSQCSRFEAGQPIRGGIPVIFPWFGPREGMTQHGFARVKPWELKEFAPAADGSVSVRLRLPEYPEASGFPPFTADYSITVNQSLTLDLAVTNNSREEEFGFENCLHTYFEVGDVNGLSITGLKGALYQDKVASFASKVEEGDAIRIGSEIDRIYLNTTSAVEVLDSVLRRKIRVEKHGSQSTVVWNPWSTKARQMPDFGDEEYKRMVCVESGNVASNSLRLAPGQTSHLKVKLSSETL